MTRRLLALLALGCALLAFAIRDVRAIAEPHGTVTISPSTLVQDVYPARGEPVADSALAPAAEVHQNASPGRFDGDGHLAAPAVPPATVTPQPDKDDTGPLGYLMSGKYLLAVGAMLVGLVAAIRVPATRYVPWFGSQAGGYTLGFGASVLTYVGTALTQGAPITIALFSTAIVAGFAASGKWGALQDALASLRKRQTPPTTREPGLAGVIAEKNGGA